ncbi:MAG: hypothetical protein AAFU79_30615 [Myxococcota bacterium]
MKRKPSLIDAWSRFGTEVLDRVPGPTASARRWVEMFTTPQRMAAEAHDAWLESLGGVSKSRYLRVVEENLELRRRLEAIENRSAVDETVEATSEAMDGAFKQLRDAQEQWLSMWLPASEPQKKS